MFIVLITAQEKAMNDSFSASMTYSSLSWAPLISIIVYNRIVLLWTNGRGHTTTSSMIT